MPTSRPAAPCTISTTNAVALAASACWLAQAASDATDLAGVQTDQVRSGSPFPSFSTGNILAGSFTPGVSGSPFSYTVDTALVSSISAFPFVMGTIFSRTGSKTASSGEEVIWALGDSVQSSCFAIIEIDDGTIVANKRIVVRVRTTAAGTVAAIDTGVDYTQDGIDAVAAVFYDSSGRKAKVYVNGTKVFDSTTTNDAFAGSVLDEASMFLLVRGGSQLFQASTSTSGALGYLSTTMLNDSDYTTWTGDPWIILEQPNTVTRGRGRAVL